MSHLCIPEQGQHRVWFSSPGNRHDSAGRVSAQTLILGRKEEWADLGRGRLSGRQGGVYHGASRHQRGLREQAGDHAGKEGQVVPSLPSPTGSCLPTELRPIAARRECVAVVLGHPFFSRETEILCETSTLISPLIAFPKISMSATTSNGKRTSD